MKNKEIQDSNGLLLKTKVNIKVKKKVIIHANTQEKYNQMNWFTFHKEWLYILRFYNIQIFTNHGL